MVAILDGYNLTHDSPLISLSCYIAMYVAMQYHG